ncbi:MAG: Fe-S oxidoreductase, partial [uncultured bacterium]
MNILLIDPKATKGGGLNTGLGWLSASIANAGHKVKVLDFVNRNISNPPEYLSNIVNNFKPDIIGFCIHCTTYTVACSLNDYIKQKYSIPVVFGGPHAAYEKENILKEHNNIDFTIVGEAEDSFLELIDCLSGRNQFSNVKGLIFRDNNKIIYTGDRPVRKEISDLPFPDYTLFGISQINEPYPIATSRGCPFQCSFCNPKMSGMIWRKRELQNVIDELIFAKKTFNINKFMLSEPVFNLIPERVIEFCSLLKKNNINLPWFSSSGLRAHLLNEKTIVAMKESGCIEIKIGIESLVPEVFDRINKKQTLEDLYNAIKLIKNHKIKLSGSFIIGLPGDTYKNALKNYHLASKLKFDSMAWSLLIPYPGTDAYDWMLKNGRMLYDYKSAHQIASDVFNYKDIQ